MYHFITIRESYLELQSRHGQIVFLTCDLDLWPMTLTFFMDVTFVITITPENFIMIRWWKHSGVTDGWTDGLNHSNPTHILFISCQSAPPFPRYGYLTIWPWYYKFMVMGEVKGLGHIVGPTTYQLTSLSPEPLFRNMQRQMSDS